MADIFLSYAREDEQRARLLAAELQERGWSVFWDRHIPHGKDFSAYIQQQLDLARCIMVLWSEASLASHFVRDEATEGLNGRLVPVLLEAVRQPLGFRQLQAADLSKWQSGPAPAEFESLVESITAIVRPLVAAAAVTSDIPSAVVEDATDPIERRRHREPSIYPPYVGGDFDADVYVSATNSDDIALVEGQRGWVSVFRQALAIRMGQLLGQQTVIWTGKRIGTAGRLHKAAVFVTVLTPAYVRSKESLGELDEFVSAHDDPRRVFKILKTPVDYRSQPPALQPLVGYEFFVVEPDTGKVRLLDTVFGPEAEREFWLRLDDVAHDVSRVLDDVRREGEGAAIGVK